MFYRTFIENKIFGNLLRLSLTIFLLSGCETADKVNSPKLDLAQASIGLESKPKKKAFKSYLPECPKEYNKQSWTACYGIRNFKVPPLTGDRYEGEWKNGLFSGLGIFYYRADNIFKGDRYQGEWKQGRFHGVGTYFYGADGKFKGDKYIGEWRDGLFDGRGTYYHLAQNELIGSKYVGQLTRGQKNGFGIYTYGPRSKYAGDKYEGDWVFGRKEGNGTYTSKGGGVYKGKVLNDKPHGKGKFIFGSKSKLEGSTYVGDYKNGKFNGTID